MTETRRHVAVIGAGPTGLTAAWKLQAAGIDVTVFEKSDHVGGRTRSIRKDGFIFDVGAITLLPTYTEIYALVKELGISQHLHQIAPVIGIPRGGRIHRLDLAHPVRSLLTTQLISAGAKLRLLKLLGPMLRSWNLSTFKTLSTLARWDHETVSTYVRRTLGAEILEYIAGPLIRGNTLNSTDCAPAGELLWMLRQYAAPFVCGFDGGCQFLADTLGARLPVEFGVEIAALTEEAQRVTVHGRRETGEFTQTFDACVVALAPPDLLTLAPPVTARQRRFLESIVPLQSVNLHVGLCRRPAATETFILPPRSEQPLLTTIVMDHNKAPGRAPAGKGVVSFFLSDDWCAANFTRPDNELLPEILAMAEPFVGDLSGDVESYVVQRWPYAIIKSDVGLYHRMREYEDEADPNRRVQIGGDFLSMGMESAVRSGAAMATRLCQVLYPATAPRSPRVGATVGA